MSETLSSCNTRDGYLHHVAQPKRWVTSRSQETIHKTLLFFFSCMLLIHSSNCRNLIRIEKWEFYVCRNERLRGYSEDAMISKKMLKCHTLSLFQALCRIWRVRVSCRATWVRVTALGDGTNVRLLQCVGGSEILSYSRFWVWWAPAAACNLAFLL